MGITIQAFSLSFLHLLRRSFQFSFGEWGGMDGGSKDDFYCHFTFTLCVYVLQTFPASTYCHLRSVKKEKRQIILITMIDDFNYISFIILHTNHIYTQKSSSFTCFLFFFSYSLSLTCSYHSDGIFLSFLLLLLCYCSHVYCNTTTGLQYFEILCHLTRSDLKKILISQKKKITMKMCVFIYLRHTLAYFTFTLYFNWHCCYCCCCCHYCLYSLISLVCCCLAQLRMTLKCCLLSNRKENLSLLFFSRYFFFLFLLQPLSFNGKRLELSGALNQQKKKNRKKKKAGNTTINVWQNANDVRKCLIHENGGKIITTQKGICFFLLQLRGKCFPQHQKR